MSTVLLSPFFYPEAISTGRYNTVLAQGLVQRGEEVQVLSSHPLYPAWRPERSKDQLPGIHIDRGGGWLRYPGHPALRRLVLEIWYAQYAALRLLVRRRQFDRIVVIFPPDLVASAVRLVLPGDVRLIGIVHDLQGVLAHRGRMIARRLLSRTVRGIERGGFNACDQLIFLSHSMADRAIAEYGISREHCSVHYPFLTLPAVSPDSSSQLAQTLPEGVNHVVYSGALGEKQDPTLLAALMRSLAARHDNLRCHIFSAGPRFDGLRSAAYEAGDSSIEYHPLVPEDVLDELYARSTIQLLPQAAGTSEGALPSKLPNLIAAGVPVFAICDGHSEIVHLMRQAGPEAGDCVVGFDAPDLHVRFARLLELANKETRASRIHRQRPLVERLFSVDRVVEEILST